MIRFTSENGNPVIVAETKGCGVYLDNDSLIDLAKGCASRRQRFVDAIQRKGTLLFSWTNAVEVAGPQGDSASAVRALLNDIGSHWVPLELNPWTVVKREQAALTTQAPVSEQFMGAYFQQRAYELSPEGNKVLDLSSENFFRLSAVLDWVQENRDSIRQDVARIDDELRCRLKRLRADYEGNPASLDRLLPPERFDQHRPATFVLLHLQRMLVVEAKAFQFKQHDGLDLCHAVLAAAYGSVVTLDKQWKERVARLPNSDRLAKTYYRPELDALVCVLESLDPPQS